MRIAGSKSWRFEHDNLDVLRRALFVRDAAMLLVTDSVDVPPRLSGEVPPVPAVLVEADRAAAARQWLQWWRRILELAVREVSACKAEEPSHDMIHADVMDRVQARTDWRHELCDPPDFAGISAWPELRSAAAGTYSSYRTWSHRASRHPAAEGGLRLSPFFAWQVVNDAVHDAAASLGVPVSEMDAVAHVIPVEGEWSYIAGPGCGVCSDAVALDPVAASELLRRLFRSAFPGAGD